MSKVTVSISAFEEVMGKMLNEIASEELVDDCVQVAKDVCKEYRTVVKGDAKRHIDAKSGRQKYVSTFTVINIKKDNTEGAAIWNSQYTLSHLIEDSHVVGTHSRTHNDYHFFKNNEEQIGNEFKKRCSEKIVKRIKNAL